MYPNFIPKSTNRKTLETNFFSYGTQREDLLFIETLRTQHDLDADWMWEDLLKEFHILQ